MQSESATDIVGEGGETANAKGGRKLKRPPPSLQRDWYRRASKGGEFRDVEILDSSGSTDGRLRTDVRTDAKSVLAREGDETAEYFRQALQFLHAYRFESQQTKRIWALHADGLSIEKIEDRLRLPHARVQRAIERLARIMRTPKSKRGRPPAGPTQHGRNQFMRNIRFSDVETEAIFFIMTNSQMTVADAVRTAVLMYARALRISGHTFSDTTVRKQGDE